MTRSKKSRVDSTTKLLLAHPDGQEGNHREDADDDDVPKRCGRTDGGVTVHAKREFHVHAEQTCEERRERYGNRHDGEVFHQLVHVVVDDACAGIHHGCQNVGVDVSLLQALSVFNLDIFEEFALGFGPVEAAAKLQLAKQRIVAVQGAHVVNQALVQAEHREEILVLHRRVESLFQVVVDAIDDFQMLVEVCDGVAQHAEHKRVQAVDFRELAFVHHRDVGVRQKQDPVLENEYAEGFHAELEIVLGGIVLGLLEHDGREIIVVFYTGKFVGVECGCYGMFRNLIFLNQDASLFLA